MRVRVQRHSRVPVGHIGIEDIYNDVDIAEIVYTFNPEDLKKDFVEELSDAFNRQAQEWAERATGETVEGAPVTVRVCRRTALPTGLRVVIDDGPETVLYVFDPEVLTEDAARALEALLTRRAVGWSHRKKAA